MEKEYDITQNIKIAMKHKDEKKLEMYLNDAVNTLNMNETKHSIIKKGQDLLYILKEAAALRKTINELANINNIGITYS